MLCLLKGKACPSRLRATWLADYGELLGLATFMHAAGISCSQRLGDLIAGLEPAAAVGRPAHLTRVHQALTSLPDGERRRLGVLADWTHGPHLLTCRQAEYTFGLVAAALGKDEPDGVPSPSLQAACDDRRQGLPSRTPKRRRKSPTALTATAPP
jgi:hypothetical protein